MNNTELPILEPGFINESDFSREPGTTFANKYGEVFTVLEDGSVFPLKDDSFRKFVDMFANNKVFTKDVLQNIPKNNPNVLVSGEEVLPDTIETYSVHNITLDVDYTDIMNNDSLSIVKKRISCFTLGKDVLVSDNRLDAENKPMPVKTITDIINTVMVSEFELDDYFDKEKSNDKLFVNDGMSINKIVLKLRKMDNPMNETDEEKFAYVVLTGAAGKEIAQYFNNYIANLSKFGLARIVNYYKDSTGETLSNVYTITATSNSSTLDIMFDERNYDIYGEVIEDKLSIHHRKYTKINVNSAPIEKKIRLIKSLVFNNNGHLISSAIRDVEIDLDISKLFYSKAMMESMFFSKKAVYTLIQGSININGDLFIPESGTFEVTGSVQVRGEHVILNSENTSVADPVIEIGKSNNGTAEEVGIVYKVYNENKPWNSNFLKRATFAYSGLSMTEIDTSDNSMKFNCSIDYAAMKAYTPDYYINDSVLNKKYYVADVLVDINAADINAILIHGARDLVNKSQTNEQILLTNYFNNFTNINVGSLMISSRVEYISVGEVNYKEMYPEFTVTNNILQNTILDLFNTVDIDKVRIRITLKVEKEILDAIGTSKIVGFDITSFSLNPLDDSSKVLLFNNIRKYAPRYYSRELRPTKITPLSLMYKNVPEEIGIDTSTYYYNNMSLVMGNPDFDRRSIVINGETLNASYMSVDLGYIGFDNYLTKVKKLKVQGNMFVDYVLGVSPTEKNLRQTNKIEPDIANYEVYADVYVKYFSDSIKVVGESEIVVDDFGRTLEIVTSTEYEEFDRYSSKVKKLTRMKVPINNKDSYYSLENKLDLDLSEHVAVLNNDVEYFKGKTVKDSLYIFVEFIIVRKHSNPAYFNYKDTVSLNNFSFVFSEADVEYRSCINDTITDPAFYTTPDEKFLNTEFNLNSNSLADATVARNAGIKSFYVNNDSSIKLSLSKASGVNYAYLGGGSSEADVEHKVFFMKARFNKGKNNLLKILMSAENIANFPKNDGVKIYGMISYIDTSKGLSYVPKYQSDTLYDSDLFVPTTNGVPAVKPDSTYTSLDEVQTVYQFLQDNANVTTYKEVIELAKPISKMYYDINEYPNDIDLYLTLMIDIPFPKNNPMFNDIELVFSKLVIKLVTDEVYRETEPLEGYSKSYGLLFKRETNDEYVSFVENSFDEENNAKYKDQLTNIQASVFEGDVDTCSEMSNPLTMKFSEKAGNLKGQLYISGTNNYKKYVQFSLENATFEKEGTIGLVDEFKKVSKLEYIPGNTTYKASAIFQIVKLMEMVNNPSSESISYMDSNGAVPPDASYINKVGTTATVNTLYLDVKSAIAGATKYNQALFDEAEAASRRVCDISAYHTDFYRQNGLASFWADEDNSLKGKVQEYEWYYYVNELFIRKSHTNNDYEHIDYNSYGSYYGNDFWLKVGQDVEVFSTKDDQPQYPGHIAEGATSFTIAVEYSGWQQWGKPPTWFENNESTRQQISYGVEYILIQDGIEHVVGGIMENKALMLRKDYVASASVVDKVYGRRPFKVVKRTYVNIKRLYNTRRTSEWVHGYIGSRTGNGAFVNNLAEWGGGRGNALPVIKSVKVYYNEYFTFPWLSPTAQEDNVDISIPGFNVYQTLQFPGVYMISEILADGRYITDILEVSTKDLNFGLCYLDEMKLLGMVVPAYAIKTIVGYTTPNIDSKNADDNKITIKYVDMSLLGNTDFLFRSHIVLPDKIEGIQLHAVESDYLNKYTTRNRIPAISVKAQISDYNPANPYAYNADGVLASRTTLVNNAGTIYMDKGATAAVNSTYSKYKFVVEMKVTNLNYLIQDTASNKTITYEPIRLPSLKIGASYWKKLSEEVPE